MLAVVAVTLAAPSSVGAHATLMSSTPGHEDGLEAAPVEIILNFSEPVVATSGSLRLLNGVGRRVKIGRIVQPQPDQVVVPIVDTLTRGSYSVAWRVISADYEPVNSFFVFHVAAPGGQSAGAVAVDASSANDSFARVTAYVLFALAAASAVILAFALRAAGAKGRQRLLAPSAALVAVLLLTAVVLIAIAGTTAPGVGGRETAVPFRAQVLLGSQASRLSVAPAEVGANRIELALPRPTAAEGGYSEVEVLATLPSADLGPLRFTGIQGADLARFAVQRAYLPLAGRWRLRVSARRGRGQRHGATVELPVAAPGA